MNAKKTARSSKPGSSIQDTFFSRLKQAMPPGLGMAEEIADQLGVSIDSAYRRIRGETEITLAEIRKLVARYPVSIDEILGQQGNSATFTYTKLTDSEENFVNYLSRLYGHLKLLNQFADRKICYVAEEVPLFYSFGSRKLAEFKLFFWQRSVLNIEKYQKIKFTHGSVPSSLIDIASASYDEYMKIPCTEVWTDETVLTNLKQVKFYFDSGLLSKDDALILLAEHRGVIEKVHAMAESGRKNVSDPPGTFTLYSSEVVLGTNCIYASNGEINYSYISFNSVNSLTTANSDFCEETENWLRNLEKKSTLISGVSEKQRYQFFSRMFGTIDSYIEAVKESDVAPALRAT